MKPVSITVCPRYQYQANFAYFDNICLEKDNAQSYTYDNDGNLISVVDHSKKQATMEYSNSDLVKNTDLKGYAYTYDYDSKHNMTKATSQSGVNYNYTYNNKGLATSLQVKTAGSYTIKSDVSYNSNGLLSSATDSSNNTTTYNYNNKSGTLTSYTDSSGTTNYEYDENTNNITQITKSDNNKEYSLNYEYSDGGKYLSKITHNNTDYNIEYDEFGNKVDSKVGNQSLANYSYNSNNGAMIGSEYGNGQSISYSYGSYGNVSSKKYNGTMAFSWVTNRNGDVVRKYDYVNNKMYDLVSDSTGRLVHQAAVNGTSSGSGNKTWYSVDYSYDLNNNITRVGLKTPFRHNVSKYEYGKDNLPTKFKINDNRDLVYTYDILNRLTNTSISTDTPITTSYSYVNNTRGQSTTTTTLAKETINGTTYKYIYDPLGNITEIQDGNSNPLYRYEYDGMSQLISDTDFVNSKKHIYVYDNAGNILSETTSDIDQNEVESNSVTINYGYSDSNWQDKLTSYNGQAITYDAIGNPLTYRNGMTMTWKNGRQLATLQNGDNSINYSYDDDSVRVSKNVNGTEYTYAYVNDLLVYETRGEAKFYYSYDSNGILYSVKYMLNDSMEPWVYYYTHNSRGDIVGIYNGLGELRAHYEYDAWGNVISVTDQNGNVITSETHIGNLNPFRYRGYYYDSETGLYYLMSRYYDPVVHRFINADDIEVLETSANLYNKNLFAYSDNNPIIRVDDGGEWWHIAIAAAIGGLVGAAVELGSQIASGEDINWGKVGVSACAGALSGAVAGATFNVGASIALNAAISGSASLATQMIDNNGKLNRVNLYSVIEDTCIGGVCGAIGGSGFGNKHLNTAGKQLTKRVTSSVKYTGLFKSATIKETGRAIANYSKNTKTIIKSGITSGILKPSTFLVGYKASRRVVKVVRASGRVHYR